MGDYFFDDKKTFFCFNPVFIDTSSAACVNINFRFGGGAASRSYDIAVSLKKY